MHVAIVSLETLLIQWSPHWRMTSLQSLQIKISRSTRSVFKITDIAFKLWSLQTCTRNIHALPSADNTIETYEKCVMITAVEQLACTSILLCHCPGRNWQDNSHAPATLLARRPNVCFQKCDTQLFINSIHDASSVGALFGKEVGWGIFNLCSQPSDQPSEVMRHI